MSCRMTMMRSWLIAAASPSLRFLVGFVANAGPILARENTSMPLEPHHVRCQLVGIRMLKIQNDTVLVCLRR